ncbi:MAG TPA: hypothetical protein VN137_04670, partial [Sphingomonas sp.]|nr:hypothetical protein [Sphingomonas sp.]
MRLNGTLTGIVVIGHAREVHYDSNDIALLEIAAPHRNPFGILRRGAAWPGSAWTAAAAASPAMTVRRVVSNSAMFSPRS